MARPVIDLAVIQRVDMFPQVYEAISCIPAYKGAVVDKKQHIKLEGEALSESSITDGIYDLYLQIGVEAGEGTLDFNGEKISVDWRVTKLIKALITSQISTSATFSKAVADFTNSLTSDLYINFGTLTLPVSAPNDELFTKVIFKELNNLVLKIVKEEGIPYKDIVEIKKSSKRKKAPAKAAKDAEKKKKVTKKEKAPRDTSGEKVLKKPTKKKETESYSSLRKLASEDK